MAMAYFQCPCCKVPFRTKESGGEKARVECGTCGMRMKFRGHGYAGRDHWLFGKPIWNEARGEWLPDPACPHPVDAPAPDWPRCRGHGCHNPADINGHLCAACEAKAMELPDSP